jgi:hypothetical protein
MKIRFLSTAFLALALALTGCGEHTLDGLFGESSSSEYTRGTVEPLLQTKWHQGDPFNSMLPLDDGSPVNGSQWTDGTRALAGCGVIAAVQIMKYHNHPSRGNGHSEPYQTKKSGILPSVSFEVDYDWNNMLNTYTSSATEQQRNAVATLVYHYGLSKQRDFFTGNQPNNILPSLTTFFKYDKSFRELYPKFYDDTEWEKIIIEQLDAGLPVLAYSASGDHAFVIDGYDNTGKLHINWGWSGKHDGYYSINALNPGGGSNMSISLIYINIKPDEGGVPAPYEMALTSFTASKTSIPQNELFTVTAQLQNVSSLETFPGGQYGAALVNSSGNIVAVIMVTTNAVTRAPNTSSSLFTLSGFVPSDVAPGQYKLRMVVKPTGGEWKIATISMPDIPTSIGFNVGQY